MSINLARTLLLVFILLGVVAASAWFTFMEPYYREVDSGWSLKARINPYFAAQRYLQRTGQDVYTTQKLSDIESISTGTTLFISHAGQVVSHKQVDHLMAWMRQGGHIIIAAQQSQNDDPLLSRFSIIKFNSNNEEQVIEQAIESVEQEFAEEADENSKTKTIDKPEDCEGECQYTALTQLRFEGIEHEFNIDFSSSAGLFHPYISEADQDESDEFAGDLKPVYWGHDDYAIQFVQFNVGDGLLTVLGSDDIWKNNYIQQYDHAYLLSILTNNSDQVMVLYGSLMPHIFVLVWQNAAELVISAAALLMMYLWFAGQRFGPIQTLRTDQRRAFNEHLLAHGDFFWRVNKQSHLLQRLRDDIIKTIEKNTAPEITSDEQKVSEYLHRRLQKQQQKRSAYTPQDIHRALYEQARYTERDFIARVRLLQELRHNL